MDIKAKRLRREGFVTGNVFGREIQGSIPVKMEKREAERLMKTCMKGCPSTSRMIWLPFFLSEHFGIVSLPFFNTIFTTPSNAANKTPATGHTIHVISQLIVQKLHAR